MNEIREQDIRALVERIVGLGVDAAAGCEKNAGWRCRQKFLPATST